MDWRHLHLLYISWGGATIHAFIDSVDQMSSTCTAALVVIGCSWYVESTSIKRDCIDEWIGLDKGSCCPGGPGPASAQMDVRSGSLASDAALGSWTKYHFRTEKQN